MSPSARERGQRTPLRDLEWLTAGEAAAYLRIGRSTLRALAIPRHPIGHRTTLYRRADLDAYAASKRVAA